MSIATVAKVFEDGRIATPEEFALAMVVADRGGMGAWVVPVWTIQAWTRLEEWEVRPTIDSLAGKGVLHVTSAAGPGGMEKVSLSYVPREE